MRPFTGLSGTAIVFLAGYIVASGADGASTTNGTKDPFTPAQRNYWAFQPVHHNSPPVVSDSGWAATAIDRFILAKLESKTIKPSPPADRLTLLRRVTFDLTGLPPTPERGAGVPGGRFAGALSKRWWMRCWRRRTTASVGRGTGWTWRGMPIAEGFKSDETRPNAWRYRDYVIKAFNEDKPYDRFVKEQIAGDELFPEDPEALVATGFNRHFPDESQARNIMQRRQEILDDITDTVGAAFLGLTYGCARCHDHKYDPILQADYYRLQAFFAKLQSMTIPVGGRRRRAEYRAEQRMGGGERDGAGRRSQDHSIR